MSDTQIARHEPGALFHKVVEANGFVFTAGVVADDLSGDARGQAAEILSEIDRLLAICNTDKSRVVSAMIWVTDIRNRDAVNEAWNAWADKPNLPVRACVEARLADPNMLVEIQVTAAK